VNAHYDPNEFEDDGEPSLLFATCDRCGVHVLAAENGRFDLVGVVARRSDGYPTNTVFDRGQDSARKVCFVCIAELGQGWAVDNDS
jgi:hypothetical protein